MQSPPPLHGRRTGTGPASTGAFAVPVSVDWEDGSASDELEVGAPDGPLVPARPGQLPTRVLRRTPVGSPPAQSQPAPEPVVQALAPTAPPAAGPPAFVPAVPAPEPVAQVPVSPPVAQVLAPVPTNVDTVPVETTLPAPSPAPSQINDADFAAPAWTRIKANPEGAPEASDWDAGPVPAFHVPSAPDRDVATQSHASEDPDRSGSPTKKRNLLTRKATAGKEVTLTKRKASASSPNGRGAWLALRITIGVITAWLLIVGLKHTVIGSTVPTTDEVAAQVSAKIGFNGFPRAAGEAFATRFASVYLTYNQASTSARAKELARFAPDATTLAWGWDGSGAQRVVDGPVVSGDPELLDKNNAIVTVAAKLDRGSWVYLAIPVYANGTGALVVSGPPAFTSAPRIAISPGKEAAQDLDSELSGQINPDMIGFFTAWAASDATALSRYTTPDATVPTTTGLGGVFKFADLRRMRIPTAGGNTRHGEVDVEWSVPGGGRMVQSYRVVIQKLDTGRWFVKDIKGGLVAAPTHAGADPNVTAPAPVK